MATKPSTIYSTNPKMDRSGITVKQPDIDWIPGEKLPPSTVTGGMLYKNGVMEQENFRKTEVITSQPMLKKAAKMVAGGMSPYGAMYALEQTKKDSNNRCSDWK